MATDGPGVLPNQTGPGVVPAQRRRGSRVLLLVALALAGVLVVGGGVAFYAYDRATAIDRSTPEVVVTQFLRATLVQKDPAKIALFVCRDWSAQAAIAKVDPPADPDVAVSWGDYSIEAQRDSAQVAVSVQFSVAVGEVFERETQMWRLDLQDQSGWRVCNLTKDASHP